MTAALIGAGVVMASGLMTQGSADPQMRAMVDDDLKALGVMPAIVDVRLTLC